MKKIGLMGAGKVAQYGHLPAIVQTPGLKLHAVYDPDPATLAQVQAQFGVPHAFTTPDDFFKSGLDAVTITSPAPMHVRNVLDAARHHLHVLCEKPLATDATDAKQMIAAMRQANRVLFVAFCYRFAEPAMTIKRLIAENAIGQVRSLRLLYLWACHGKFDRSRPGEHVIQQRRHLRMLEGGPMIDCGTHQIDLARWWLGSEVTRVEGHGAWLESYDVPDHIWAHLTHGSGAHTMVEISYSYAHTAADLASKFVYEIIGTDGLIVYDREAKRFEVRTPSRTQHLPFAEEKNFAGMYAAFAKSLETGLPGDLCTAEDGEIVTEIALTATQKAAANR